MSEQLNPHLPHPGPPNPGQDAGLAKRFPAVRALSRAIALPLSDADASIQPMDDASPAKWHLAHSSWFFETFVLRDHLPGYSPFDDRWAFLFNSYYDGEGVRHPRSRRGMLSRPGLTEVQDYRSRIDEAILKALPSLPPTALGLIELGLQHEQQHQELMLMDMLALFSENPLLPALWPGEAGSHGPPATTLAGVPHPGGLALVGHDGAGFSFDCERPRHQVLLHPHELADRPVTNGEWLRFIEEGGYSTPTLWLTDGWAWRCSKQIEAPLYWQDGRDGWLRFGLDGLQPLNLAEPVCHIAYYEADAFARWAGARLPTEFEWEAAAASADSLSGNQLDSAGPVRPAPASLSGTSPSPGLARSLQAPRQLFGDVWEWTMSPFLPYPGFRPEEGVVGEYNGKFMCNQFVLRGGSCATPRGHVRSTYRNFFYPHQRWQFSGVRLARDVRP